MYPAPTTGAGYCSISPAPENASSGAGDCTTRPENRAHFQGRVVPSPAPGDAFIGAGEMLQYPAPVVGVGYICTRPWKKKRRP